MDFIINYIDNIDYYESANGLKYANKQSDSNQCQKNISKVKDNRNRSETDQKNLNIFFPLIIF